MPLSIEESIARLRAEILAQDWKLSPGRTQMLKAAFVCLKQRFKNRKTPHDLLVMADNVLDHGIKNNYMFKPQAIDFLKEAMAHVVSLYEDPLFDPDREVKLLKTYQAKIARLMTTLRQSLPPASKTEANGMVSATFASPATVAGSPSAAGSPPVVAGKQPLADREEFSEEEQKAIEQVMSELKSSIPSTVDDTDSMRHRLESFLAAETDRQERQTVTVATRAATSGPSAKEADSPIADCPETPVRLMVIGTTTIGIPDNDIAMVTELAKAQREKYLKSGSVPLKDFSRFMQSLARRLKGPLAARKESFLKQMIMPVMVPRSLELPPLPDESATALVMLGDGQWNGVILCARILDHVPVMTRFQKARNGDISGNGFLADGTKFPLLNVISVLRREGFLVIS